MMEKIFTKKLLPAVTLNDADSAQRLAETYLDAGLDILEITFRTDATLSSIEAIAKEFPSLKIGAGTILNTHQVAQAKNAGAQFGLSPGFNAEVVKAAQKKEFPFIPGIMTPSEIEVALSTGCRVLKLFPADISGGPEYIKSLEGPYQHTGMQLIPMGGINPQNMKAYLGCSSVLAVGGSWMAPKDKIDAGDFSRIAQVIRETRRNLHF
ncbi:MAG: bifunctional 4-hydroxy-2-oxoglutarate aldolase/2-dehydro-3-deoxy-phosphogluconate aldolase [Balneolaceae bacterium]|nr:bifunctional 4-hydroxy-2-oxoglutarate aldolase/2-dehydro-3-deoxy-phosphogluconate aldolase [Balneolaceae bacterium]